MQDLCPAVFVLDDDQLALPVANKDSCLEPLDNVHLGLVLEVDDLDDEHDRPVIDTRQLNTRDAVLFGVVFGQHEKRNARHAHRVLDREYKKVILILKLGRNRIVGVEVGFLFSDFSHMVQVLFGLRFAHDL